MLLDTVRYPVQPKKVTSKIKMCSSVHTEQTLQDLSTILGMSRLDSKRFVFKEFVVTES